MSAPWPRGRRTDRLDQRDRGTGDALATVTGKAATSRRTNAVVEALRPGRRNREVVILSRTSPARQPFALNATIEAARPASTAAICRGGQRSQGAANQTAQATEKFHAIQSIQAGPAKPFSAIQAIGATIAEINEISNAIAAAVEQQGSATRESPQCAAGGERHPRGQREYCPWPRPRRARASASKLLDAATGLSSHRSG